MKRGLMLGLIALCWGLAFADRPTWMNSAETITPTDLRAHLEFIASDALEGRDTPSRGLELAGMYIVSHLQRWGLKPAGENGTYYQTMTYQTATVQTAESRIEIGGRAFRYGEGFVARAVPLNTTARLVYVGNGWSNPSKGIDPYEGLDLQDAIMVVHAGYPKPVQELGLEKAREAGWVSPEENALKHGAVAILRIDPNDMERIDRLARFWSQRRAIVELEANAPPVPLIVPSRELLNLIFAGEAHSAEEIIQRAEMGDPVPPFALGQRKQLSVKLEVQTTSATARSVIAYVEGSDPVLKHEFVSIGAHLDHVGVGRADSRGDTIYNGADDNGSGSVALLELAEALATGPRPKRSVLFLWYAGEEKGLLGSRLFTERPTVPLENIVVNINIDMIGRSRQPNDTNPRNKDLSAPDEVYVIGPRVASPDLGKVLERVNSQYLNLKLNPMYDDKNHPEQLYYRSDHVNFVRKGIPAIFFFTGLHEDYHRPSDHPDKIDYEKMARITRTILGLLWELADSSEKPARVSL
ncbi:MAG: M28 family peptidase [Fimbriimonadales bacterium]|nr:M28 family peptidase [Fimbriimonadales bacterium]CUU38510.1 Zn-dependent amino-or carboxypeptidase, M28 family [Armatimonadetes bacterium DC]